LCVYAGGGGGYRQFFLPNVLLTRMLHDKRNQSPKHETK